MKSKDYINNLLIVAYEECVEIQKEVCKAIRFGINSRGPRDFDTNGQKIVQEFYQLEAVLEMLVDDISECFGVKDKYYENINRLEIMSLNELLEMMLIGCSSLGVHILESKRNFEKGSFESILGKFYNIEAYINKLDKMNSIHLSDEFRDAFKESKKQKVRHYYLKSRYLASEGVV